MDVVYFSIIPTFEPSRYCKCWIVCFYYTLLLGLDGEASLGNTQITYKLYDENGNLLNECGELEAAAYRYFVEE